MKRIILALSLGAIAAVIAMSLRRAPSNDALPTMALEDHSASQPKLPAISVRVDRRERLRNMAPVASSSATPFDWDQSFREAKDASAFLTEVQGLKTAEPRALYYAGKMLQQCEAAANTWYAKERAGPRDAVTQVAYLIKAGVSPPTCELNRIQRTWERCRSIYESNDGRFGSPSSWFERAARAGDPLAKAKLGVMRWNKVLETLATHKSLRTATPATPNVDAEAAEALQLISESARSGEPEALSQLALAAPMKTGVPDIRRGALLLATCRGDRVCAHNSELACYLSISDPSLDGTASVTQILERQYAGSDFEDMRERAARVIATWSAAEVDELFVEPFQEMLEMARGGI